MDSGHPHESKKQRVDRELVELLNEIRVALPGVEVLFAFLLTVPFYPRFTELSDTQQRLFFGVFLCAAAAIALLVAPTAYHRLQWRLPDKEQVLLVSNRLVIAGLTVLTLAINGIIFLVTDLILSRQAALTTVSLTGLFFVGLWFALPLIRRRGNGHGPPPV